MGLKGRRNSMLKKKRIEAFKRERKQVRFFFQTGRGRFNIFITLTDYCGGYPKARGDEFPTWSFEVARCVFVYTYSDHLCPLYRGGGTYSELVCMGINILLYIFILIYVYKHVCICICMYVFIHKNIEGLL